MNNHCWRNSRPRIDDDDERTWPKLPHVAVQETQNIKSILRPQISRTQHDFAGSASDNEMQENLNLFEYPKLGEVVLKKKRSSVESNSLEIHENFEDSSARRFRRHRSTDLIHINLQKTLQQQKWPCHLQTKRPTKITVDICKLNVNMSVASPLDGRWLLSKPKKSSTYIAKKKKLSRLKWLILFERIAKKHHSENRQQIRAVDATQDAQQDILQIDFNRINVNIVSHDNSELVKKMSALSCLNMNYRDTREINITEDTVTFRPDLHEKMKCLSLENVNGLRFDEVCSNYDVKDVCNIPSIDCERVNTALNLKVCDETGEFTDNIVIKEEPSSLCFSNKFREYCTNTVTLPLRKHLKDFLAELWRLQKKTFEKNSVKAKLKKRYYAGIKEVQKHVELKKMKFVIIATDLEQVKIEGGLDDILNKLIGTCKRYEVPYCFGLGKRKLGYYVPGKGIASCIGIANYSGAEEKLKNVLLELVQARNDFARLVGDEAKIVDVNKLLPQEGLILSEIINAYLKILTTNS